MRDLKDSPTAQHIITSDGSSTLFSSVFNQHYHSIHGAVQESMHVFIQAGLRELPTQLTDIRIFEMGFGTGLNALLSCMHKESFSIQYTSIEAYPISEEQVAKLNYPSILSQPDLQQLFQDLHELPWGITRKIREGFSLSKHHTKLQDFSPDEGFDLIYFDAFGPSAQPELWTDDVMTQMAAFLKTGGIFVTYSAKSSVRKGLIRAGLEVEKIPGPPGKREMLRAKKE
ncbi:MAG: tRNA (5-methylaminomethyl-2-thiouridine)(34)-methyltransferase MnmD [Bacteroidota bacterium]